MDLLILVPSITPRIQYTFELLFKWIRPIPFQLTINQANYLAYSGPKLNYTSKRLSPSELFIPKGTILFENNIKEVPIKIRVMDGFCYFFESTQMESDFPFDLPGMSFWLASRYEEYLPYEKDQHSRFSAPNSLAFKNGFLDVPLINYWAHRLYQQLKARFPTMVIPPPIYEFQSTLDIDLAWAYKHKGWWRTAATLIKKLLRFNVSALKEQLAVLAGQKPDPFFTFSYIQAVHQQQNIDPTFFFLLGDYGKYDKNVSPKSFALKALIQSLQEQYRIGIHPSYGASTGNGTQLQKEVNRLMKITGQPPNLSRQHFLKLHLPQTYRQLIAAGITSDYTMGYAAQTGFRASIASPFPWYDLEQEKITALMLLPFQAMDVTLKQYLQLSPSEALENITKLVHSIQTYGGCFSIIWHNSSLSQLGGWENWRATYAKILEIAAVPLKD